MNTKKVLLLSEDKDLIGVIRMSALTLTKLNCQVDFHFTGDEKHALSESKADDLNLIIIDESSVNSSAIDTIVSIRGNEDSKSKKIILLYDREVEKQNYFDAGCDSIMSKSEFAKAVNNILVF